MNVASVDDALTHAGHLCEDRPDLALEQAQEVLIVVPGHPAAQLLVGKAQRLLGLPKQSHSTLAPLSAAQPRSAAIAYELGRTLCDLERAEEAIGCFQHAAALMPYFTEAWMALGDTLRTVGRNGAADHAYLGLVEASTNDPVLRDAAIALSESRFETAEKALRERLKARPTDVPAIRMLGELALRIGRIDDGITLLRRTLDLSPSFDAARELLARTLTRTGRLAEGLAEIEALLETQPGHASHLMLKASLLARMGDQDGARLVYEDVLARHPTQPLGWMSYGHVLKTVGRTEDALLAYRRAIEQQPTLGEAWWSLANLKTWRFSPTDVAAMRTALDHSTDETDQFHLHFAIGKAFEDAGEDGDAFSHYATGNRIRHGQLRYSADDTAAQCSRAKQLITPSFSVSRPERGCHAPDPIFIVGLPRSGSTLIEQILASHSQIEGTMELPDMMAIAADLAGRAGNPTKARYPEIVGELSDERLRALGDDYLTRTRLQRTTNRPFFTDKMPNNWQHVGLIHAILPKAKIVDARRHPIGCCFSAWKQHFARGQAFSYDLSDVGRYYRDYVAAMDHVDAVMPGRVHRVIYEEMVVDTEFQVRRLLDYLGLPFEDNCLQFWRNDRAVRTASSEQVRQPIYGDAIDHWRRFEPMLAPLLTELGDLPMLYPNTNANVPCAVPDTRPIP